MMARKAKKQPKPAAAKPPKTSALVLRRLADHEQRLARLEEGHSGDPAAHKALGSQPAHAALGSLPNPTTDQPPEATEQPTDAASEQAS